MKKAFGPKRSKGFRDKYLAPIMIAAAFLISFNASAQNDPDKYTYYRYLYGNKTDRMWADKVLITPNDTIYSKDGIAVIDSVLYIGNGSKWSKVSGGSNGSPNSNIGTGYKIAVNGTNNIKTIIPGYGQSIDSATNSLTFKIDTGTIFPAIRSTVPINNIYTGNGSIPNNTQRGVTIGNNSSLVLNKGSSDSSAITIDQSHQSTKTWMTIRPPIKNDSTLEFNWISAMNANDDGTRSNHVVKFGSNLSGYKNRAKIYDAWESNWYSGGANFLERHYETQLANGETCRLFSSTFINRGTLATSDNTWDFRFTNFNFKSLTNADIASISPNQFNLFGTNPYIRLYDAGAGEITTLQQNGADLNLTVRRSMSITNSLGGIREFYLNNMYLVQLADVDILQQRTTNTDAFAGLLLKSSTNSNLAGIRANAVTGEIRIGSLDEGTYPSFYSANTEVGRFSLNGYFGLNTSTPEQRLHVKGQVKIDSLTTGSEEDSVVVSNNGVLKVVPRSGFSSGEGGDGSSPRIVQQAVANLTSFSFSNVNEVMVEYIIVRSEDAVTGLKIGTTNGGSEIWIGDVAADDVGHTNDIVLDIGKWCPAGFTFYVSGNSGGGTVSIKYAMDKY